MYIYMYVLLHIYNLTGGERAMKVRSLELKKVQPTLSFPT